MPQPKIVIISTGCQLERGGTDDDSVLRLLLFKNHLNRKLKGSLHSLIQISSLKPPRIFLESSPPDTWIWLAKHHPFGCEGPLSALFPSSVKTDVFFSFYHYLLAYLFILKPAVRKMCKTDSNDFTSHLVYRLSHTER